MPTRPNEDLPQDARVLMIRMSALGDIIFALETLSTLKHERPDVRVDFLVEDRFASILADHPLIERLVVFPRKSPRRIPAHLWRLRRSKYDVILDLHGIQKSALQVWLARARLKVGYAAPAAREGASFAYHRKVPVPDPPPHRAECGGYLLRAIGLRNERRSATLPEVPAPTVFADDGPRAILHPGTSAFAQFKRWPLAKHAELARRLATAGWQVAVSFGPGERGLFEAIRAGAATVLPIDGKELGLLGLAQVMRGADVVVAADTGPLHMATAAGTRVVALFGPKEPARYGPRGTESSVLFHDVPCRPCQRRTCASPQCVLGIAVDTVLAHVLGTPAAEAASQA